MAEIAAGMALAAVENAPVVEQTAVVEQNCFAVIEAVQ